MQSAVRFTLTIVTLGLGIACSGRSQSPAPADPVAPNRPAAAPARDVADSGWIKSESANKTVTLHLSVTRPADSQSAVINGYRAGQAQIVVPLRWTVKWDWRNQDPSSPHSLVLMVQREKLPLEGGRAAFSNAMSRSVTSGLNAGQSDQTTFEAEEAGWYWLMCGVPSHALNGEWLELQVSPDAPGGRVQLKQR